MWSDHVSFCGSEDMFLVLNWLYRIGVGEVAVRKGRQYNIICPRVKYNGSVNVGLGFCFFFLKIYYHTLVVKGS